MSFLSDPNATLGIDINDHVVRAVLMKGHGRKHRIHQFGQVSLDSDIIENGHIKDIPAFQKKMKRLFSRGLNPWRATAVVGLPEMHGFIKTLIASPDEEEKEIQKHLPFPYEEVTMDSIRNGNMISFAAIKKEVATRYMQALCPLGLHVRALEIESQAVARLFAAKRLVNEWKGYGIILGDIGHTQTTFMVIRDGLIEFTHTSKLISGRTLTQFIQNQFGVSADEAEGIKLTQQDHPSMEPLIRAHTESLANELKRVVDFHQSHPIDDTEMKGYIVYLMGGGSRLNNLRQYLEERVRYPVQQAKLTTHIVTPRKLRPLVLSYGTAIGLSLREFNPL